MIFLSDECIEKTDVNTFLKKCQLENLQILFLEQIKNPLQWIMELPQFLLWWKVALPRTPAVNGA